MRFFYMMLRSLAYFRVFAVFFGFLIFSCSLLSRESFAVGADRAKAMGLLPHRAMYDIQLSSKKSGSQVVNISGKMLYEWQPSCDAWVSNHHFNLMYEYADAPAVRIESDFSTYESFDGKTFNFTSQRKANGEILDELRGAAYTGESGKPAEALYTIPQDLTYEMPEGTLFPMGHTLAVLEKLKDGKIFFSATTFDGSDKEGPVEINTFLGKPAILPEVLTKNKDINQSFLKSKAWNMRLAFFPLNKSESQSDYEMDLIFHENGVISDMLVDYGNFSVTQKLTAIEPLEDACKAGVKKEDGRLREQ